MNNKVIIQDERISLVQFDESMANDVWLNSLDEDNRTFVPDEVFETIEEAQDVVKMIIESYQSKDGPFIYAIIRNEDKSNLGYVQLVKIEEGWEIGYHIAKQYTMQGYATEALKLFLEYLKDNNIKEVYGVALSANKASRRVLEKCGFTTFYEGEGLYQGSQRNIIKSKKKL